MSKTSEKMLYDPMGRGYTFKYNIMKLRFI